VIDVRIYFNAPVVLSFSILAILFFAIGGSEFSTQVLAARPVISFSEPLDYLRLFLHSMGHASWDHLLNNLVIILLVGPILEEKYGSAAVAITMFFAALATGLINTFFLQTGLLGASDIAFMLIILSSIVNVRKGGIPLTFLLVVVVYLGNEILHIKQADNISHIAHLVGGSVGAIAGYFLNRELDA